METKETLKKPKTDPTYKLTKIISRAKKKKFKKTKQKQQRYKKLK